MQFCDIIENVKILAELGFSDLNIKSMLFGILAACDVVMLVRRLIIKMTMPNHVNLSFLKPCYLTYV